LGKIDLEVFEDKFLKKYSIYYELSILVGVDSLCYSIADKYQQFLGLRKYSYSSPPASFRDLASHVSGIIQDDSILRRPYAKTRLAIFHPYAALVPNRLYNDAEKPAYLEKLIHLAPGDLLFSDELPFADAMAVYPLDGKLVESLKAEFPGATFCHAASALSRSLAPLHTDLSPTRIFFNLRDGVVQVFAFDKDDLVLLNAFTFLESADLVYYLMLVYQQLSWKPESTPLYAAGLLVEDSAIYRNLLRYFPNLQFVKVPAQYFQFGARFELDFRKHWFMDLFSISNGS
jgi:hypothetical protein